MAWLAAYVYGVTQQQ